MLIFDHGHSLRKPFGLEEPMQFSGGTIQDLSDGGESRLKAISKTDRVWNGTFRQKLPFVFSGVEGPICEGLVNGNGGQSIFATPFET
jgi:hypothetical protein